MIYGAWRDFAQPFSRYTLIYFACLPVWQRVIGAWHTELADKPVPDDLSNETQG
jgi:hypothetical protein